jgi:hypothetical protein
LIPVFLSAFSPLLKSACCHSAAPIQLIHPSAAHIFTSMKWLCLPCVSPVQHWTGGVTV